MLEPGAKAGTFVEIKNSHIGEGAKVPHLAYVGDADVGAGSNLGAGTITANYDGFRKNRTVIGANARIGVDTMLIAPVEVGDSRLHWRWRGDQGRRARGGAGGERERATEHRRATPAARPPKMQEEQEP